jgi:hypothetical protein
MAFASDKGRQGAAGVSTGGYSIDNSVKLNNNEILGDGGSTYFTRTPATTGNRRTFTVSTWFKLSASSAEQSIFTAYVGSGNQYISCGIDANDNLNFHNYDTSGVAKFYYVTDMEFRDPSAWYHLSIIVDTTLSTQADRIKIYINGEQLTSFSYRVDPSQNTDTEMSTTILHKMGYSWSNTPGLVGYLAEVNFVDGQALTPADFGETGDYGEWKAIAYAGTYGTNGFYLDFKNSGSLGNDASSNSNNWTPTNLAATDQMLDSPTNNFCTLNPLDLSGTTASFYEGNLVADHGTSGDYAQAYSSFKFGTGKWYAECVVDTDSAGRGRPGIITGDTNAGTNAWFGMDSFTYAYNTDGRKVNNSSWSSYGASYTTTDVIGITVDADTGVLTFYKNGVSQGTAYSSLTGDYRFGSASEYLNPNKNSVYWNFGQDSSFAGNKTAQGNADGNGIGDFYYAPPTGFLALCTQNLPEPTVVPSEHFNTVLWSGDGSATRSITGVGFEPSMLWAKNRTSVSNHNLIDAVRGVDVRLLPASTIAELDSAFFASLDSDGFSLDNANDNDVNQSGKTYVAWNWKANGAGVSNTNGSITSTVSANADAGFSIVSWTGNNVAATMGHGLTVAPELVILKGRDFADNWYVWHEALAATEVIRLDITNAKVSSDLFSNTEPTASVFSIKAGYNLTGRDFITYCFHSVDGYSKVGSYTGNGSTDGTFVHCGFRPAYVMLKNATLAGEHWVIFDSTRDIDNVLTHRIYANDSAGEGVSGTALDLVSNGFKMREGVRDYNGSGDTFIFLAFAEVDFKHSNAR